MHLRKPGHAAEHIGYRVVAVSFHHVGQFEVSFGGFLFQRHRMGQKFR